MTDINITAHKNLRYQLRKTINICCKISIFQKCASTKHETVVIFINEFMTTIDEYILSLLKRNYYTLLFFFLVQ